MPNVKFVFDKEKDIWNIWDKINNPPRGFNPEKNFPKNMYENVINKTLKEATPFIEKRQEKLYNSGFINIKTKSLQSAWDLINDEYFNRLEKLTGNKFDAENITAYIHTMGPSPYNCNKNNAWFMVNFNSSLIRGLGTCAHELIHFDFHYNDWEDMEEKVGKINTWDIKEGLTELLNFEFLDLYLSKDIGYPIHDKLREFISQEWKKEKDYHKLLDKCMNYIKENTVHTKSKI